MKVFVFGLTLRAHLRFKLCHFKEPLPVFQSHLEALKILFMLGKTKLRNVCVDEMHEKRQRDTAKSGLHITLHSVMSRTVRLCDV